MSPRTRVWLLVAVGAAVLATAALRVVPGNAPAQAATAVVEPVPARRPAPVASAPAGETLPAPRGRALGGSKADAFAAMNWKPAPPPPPVAVAPPPPPPVSAPPPSAPPLPFVFVGMAERGADRPQAYLAKGNTLLVVSAGELIDGGRYRVDALSPTGVSLTYLPLNKQQTLSIP